MKPRMSRLFVFGAGGHARCVVDALRQLNMAPEAIIVDAPEASHFEGIPIISAVPAGCSQFDFVVAVGACDVRALKFKLLLGLGGSPSTVIHPRAYVSPAATIGEGSVVLPLACVDVGARVGKNSIINVGAAISHDCEIGDHVHVAVNATVCGGVKVESGAWVGAGASLLQGVKIGKDCVIGMGATILSDISPSSTVVNNVKMRFLTSSGETISSQAGS